jgi:hypothetical protein
MFEQGLDVVGDVDTKKKQIMALDPKGLNASRGWSSVWLLMT